MTGEHRLSLSPAVAVAVVLAMLLIGAGGTYLVMRPGTSTPASSSGAVDAGGSEPAVPPTATAAAADAGSFRPEVVVTLSKDAADRAGIKTSSVTPAAGSIQIRVPGVVEPNGYRQVAVTPLVGGRVVNVAVQLGERVRRGQTLARVYSPELAEARTKYVAAKAMLDAHDRELQRTERLVEIGAASRQELERIHAEHAAQTSEVESTRARLQLLGDPTEGFASSGTDSATVIVTSPSDGVVTERLANPGLNVDPATKIFSIVDLSNVWIVADVYEQDLGRIREGSPATVTADAYPGLALRGRVSYIDPQLNVGTRTARARIEVANARGDLRLGMYANVAIDAADGASVVGVPPAAVQSVGDRQVVYVAVPGDSTKFIEREVRLGNRAGDLVQVVSGLSADDAVVTAGSFFLRAEAERRGLRAGRQAAAGAAQVQTARIAVTEKGYEPGTIALRAGIPARLTVVRTTDATCGTEIVFPSLGITRALPLNQPVVIEFTPAKTGDIAFVCGMNMLKGVVVVQ